MDVAVLGADHWTVYALVSHEGGTVDDADWVGHLDSCLDRTPVPRRGLHSIGAHLCVRFPLEIRTRGSVLVTLPFQHHQPQ